MLPVVQWSQKEVGDWLVENGFESYKHEFCEKHGIDGPSLLTLSEEDLKGPPMGFQRLGDIKRIMICVRQLQLENRTSIHHLSVPELRGHLNPPDFQRMRSSADSTHSGDDTDSMAPRSSNRRSGAHKLEPEYIKCLISFMYMMSVFLLTAFVMVIVHDRVPDVKRYPPLPDIVLDNLPYIPWAFEVCELSGVTLLLIWSTTLFFHKHRFILMRRMFSMTGTIFLLRCVTMLITSLSVPGTHLDCQPVLKNYAGPWSVIERALTIWRGCGMSLQGVRSCGDYMFSGHTVIVTILNFFITEYTPRRMYWVHTTTWILNIFAVFFILAAHEHYSIDVFIAFYITSRLFLYYHSLANNRALTQGDRRRTRVWFPLFSYFESSIAGIVPNEYEWPFQIIQKYLKYPAEKRKTT